MTNWLKHIKNTYKYVETEPEMVAPIVRDWPITKEAGLDSLAWAMCQDGYISSNDAKFLLEKLEEFVTK